MLEIVWSLLAALMLVPAAHPTPICDDAKPTVCHSSCCEAATPECCTLENSHGPRPIEPVAASQSNSFRAEISVALIQATFHFKAAFPTVWESLTFADEGSHGHSPDPLKRNCIRLI
jgi:hypothetical protein